MHFKYYQGVIYTEPALALNRERARVVKTFQTYMELEV
jgi:hypothetical protein